MTEEEKKAIEYWKNYMDILHWNTQLASEHYLQILLNYIEKLEKEKREYEYTIAEMVQTREDYFISKDKIRNKIKDFEEIERQLAFIQNESYARKVNKDFILLLKSLLMEN